MAIDTVVFIRIVDGTKRERIDVVRLVGGEQVAHGRAGLGLGTRDPIPRFQVPPDQGQAVLQERRRVRPALRKPFSRASLTTPGHRRIVTTLGDIPGSGRRDWRLAREIFVAETDDQAMHLSVGGPMGLICGLSLVCAEGGLPRTVPIDQALEEGRPCLWHVLDIEPECPADVAGGAERLERGPEVASLEVQARAARSGVGQPTSSTQVCLVVRSPS